MIVIKSLNFSFENYFFKNIYKWDFKVNNNQYILKLIYYKGIRKIKILINDLIIFENIIIFFTNQLILKYKLIEYLDLSIIEKDNSYDLLFNDLEFSLFKNEITLDSKTKIEEKINNIFKEELDNKILLRNFN